MNRTLSSLTLLAVAAVALAGCGKQGQLVRPAPLFGTKAKQQYEAEKTLAGQRAAEADAQRRQAEEAQEVDKPNDNAPLTPRDVKDPAQKLSPLSSAPIPGAPQGPSGPPSSLTPLN